METTTVQDLRSEVDESEQEVDARDAEHIAVREERVDRGWDFGAAEPVAEDPPVEDLIAIEDVIPEPPAQEPEYVEDEDPDLQIAILQSCSTRPLTPLGRCIGLSQIVTMRKTAGGLFEDQHFPYHRYSYQAPMFAHAELYSFAKYHLLPPLQNLDLQSLALQRMTQTLRNIDCSVDDAEKELSAIIDYIYNNIESNGDDEEPMQKLLSQFSAIHYPALLHGKFEELFSRGGKFTRDVARKLSQRLFAHGAAAEMEDYEVGCRIEGLENQIQRRDISIRSLTDSLNDATVWGRGMYRKGNRKG